MADSQFWADQAAAQQTVQQLKSLKGRLAPAEAFQHGVQEFGELLPLVDPHDTASVTQLAADLAALERECERLELQRMLGGEADARHAILSVHSGAGGTESCDWTQMLLRMYRRWAEERGFATEVIDLLPGLA